MNMKYDKEVLTINDILNALDNFDNKEEIINAIKQSLYDIETDWHHEEYLRHQLQSYKQKEDKIIKWCYEHGQAINATDILDIIDPTILEGYK